MWILTFARLIVKGVNHYTWGMKPFFTLHETRDPTLPWQVRSNIRNENAEFADLGIKPDYYIAGFGNKEAAIEYMERCG